MRNAKLKNVLLSIEKLSLIQFTSIEGIMRDIQTHKNIFVGHNSNLLLINLLPNGIYERRQFFNRAVKLEKLLRKINKLTKQNLFWENPTKDEIKAANDKVLDVCRKGLNTSDNYQMCYVLGAYNSINERSDHRESDYHERLLKSRLKAKDLWMKR